MGNNLENIQRLANQKRSKLLPRIVVESKSFNLPCDHERTLEDEHSVEKGTDDAFFSSITKPSSNYDSYVQMSRQRMSLKCDRSEMLQQMRRDLQGASEGSAPRKKSLSPERGQKSLARAIAQEKSANDISKPAKFKIRAREIANYQNRHQTKSVIYRSKMGTEGKNSSQLKQELKKMLMREILIKNQNSSFTLQSFSRL